MARAVETAAPLALARRLPIRIVPDLDEVDFGDWTGLSFAQLDGRSDWAEYNNSRDTAAVPRGESADMVCTRITRALESLRQQCRGGIVAAVTHAEIIRYAVLLTRYVPIREWQEIDVKPASIASIQWDDELHNHDRDGNTLPESLGPAVVVLDGDRDGSLPANPR